MGVTWPYGRELVFGVGLSHKGGRDLAVTFR